MKKILISFVFLITISGVTISGGIAKADFKDDIKKFRFEQYKNIDISDNKAHEILRTRKLYLMLIRQQFSEIEKYANAEFEREKKIGRNIKESNIAKILQFYGNLTLTELEEMKNPASEYKKRFPRSIFPYLLEAHLYYALAFEIRAADKRKYSNYIANAKKNLFEAIKINSNNPVAITRLMWIYNVIGDSTMTSMYADSLGKLYPKYMQWINLYAFSLLPQWGGTVPVAFAFINQKKEEFKGEKNKIPAIIISMHESLSYVVPDIYKKAKEKNTLIIAKGKTDMPYIEKRSQYINNKKVWNDITKAVKYLEKNYPDDMDSFTKYANMAAEVKKDDIAIKYYNLAIDNATDIDLSLYKEKEHPLKMRAKIYLKKGNKEKAINDLKRMVELVPESAESQSKLAVLLMGANMKDVTTKYASQAIALLPENPEAWRVLCSNYADFVKNEKQFNYFNKAMKACNKTIKYSKNKIYQADARRKIALIKQIFK